MEALKIDHLSVNFHTNQGNVQAIRDVSLSLYRGEILALVGESGCGKTTLCRSVIRLLPSNANYHTGQILMDDTNLLSLSERQMMCWRGSRIAMVFQDPLNALNPCMTVGQQISQIIQLHNPSMNKNQLRERTVELLNLVGIHQSEQRSKHYPHQFSGGMRQRIVLAMALAGNPQILLADEPTTALDVTTQAQILTLITELKDKLGLSVIFVTHDLGVVARVADRVAVMYAGKVVEIGNTDDIFYHPCHPYTCGLLESLPAIAQNGAPLNPIPGVAPSLIDPPAGDAFAPRNPQAQAIDFYAAPPLFRISDTHFAATWLLAKSQPGQKRDDYVFI